MERLDGAKSNEAGLTVKPTFTTRSASLIKYFSCLTQLSPEWLNMIQEEISRAIELSGTAVDGSDDEQLFNAIKDIADTQIALSVGLNGRLIGFGEIVTSSGAMNFSSPGITGSALGPVGEAQVNIPTEPDTDYAVVLGNVGIDTFGCLIGGSKTTTKFGVKSSGVDPIGFAIIRL